MRLPGTGGAPKRMGRGAGLSRQLVANWKMRLCNFALGRVLLHAGCLARGGRKRFHLAGMGRELRRVIPNGRFRRIVLGAICAASWGGGSEPLRGQEFTTNTYTISTEDFANPERGFYIQADSYASAPSSIPGNLANYRINGKNSPGNTYSAKISLFLRVFYLDAFVAAPISASFLSSIQTDLAAIRAAGCKAIVRFAYNQDQTSPFDEPAKERILLHIAQLKPLLQQNADVIAVLQHGFIGAWGEGYYTDIFYTSGNATVQNWLDRADVIAALLDALPAARMVQVRVPQHKQKFLYGPYANSAVPPLDPSEVLNGSGPARIGFHNDCFLADPTDFGTYADYDLTGGGTTAADIINFRNYLAAETRFTPMGGETCAVNPPADDCASAGGGADSDMATYHYSFLNQGYNAAVNDGWAAQGCIESIKRRLGYRLQLVSSRVRTEAQPGQMIPFELVITNAGYAAPFNPRGIELVLRHTGSGQKYFAELSRDTDARRWLPGTNHTLSARLKLPGTIPAGSYELLLNLPDSAPTLYASLPFSMRLANSNAVSSSGTVLATVWDATTGYHRLGHTLTINAAATNAAPDGTEIPVLNYSAVAENYAAWRARHFAAHPADGAPELDPDADGRPNLVEYAVGSDPNANQTVPYLSVGFATNTFFLSVPKGPGASHDVRYEIEGATTLNSTNWSGTGLTILENSARQIRAQYVGTNASGFLRMKFSFAP